MRNEVIKYNLNILLTGDVLTNEYIQFFKLRLQIKVNPLTNIPLPWNVFDCHQGITVELLESFAYDHQPNKYQLPDNFVIICVIKTLLSNYPSLLMDSVIKLKAKQINPFIIFSSLLQDDTQLESMNELKGKFSKEFDMRQISTIYHKDNDPIEVFNKLYQICSYYNQLGDDNTFPDIMKYNVNGNGNVNITNDNYQYNQLFTLNMIIVGRSGVGKSTLVNILLDEKKAEEGKEVNQSETRTILKYYHKKYPLIIYDTPGINKNNYKTIIEFIQSNSMKSKCNPKKQIHLIIYVENANQIKEGNTIDEAVKLVLSAMNNNITSIPSIFYLLTNSQIDTLINNKAAFLNIYSKVINNTYIDNICLCNLTQPYYGIGIFLDSIFSFMLKNSLFVTFLLSNSTPITQNDIFISIHNQIFEKLMQYKPIHNEERIKSPEIKLVTSNILREIYYCYGIPLNNEWNQVIEHKALNSFTSLIFSNDYFMNDFYYINKEIRTKTDCLNYLTHLTIEAYLEIERNIKINPELIDLKDYLTKELLKFMEGIVKEMLNKYKS